MFSKKDPLKTRLAAETNLITIKNLIPSDKPDDWDRPSGLRIGTIEITRLGLMGNDMNIIADFFKRVLIDGEDTESVRVEVEAFRLPLQFFYYNFDSGWPGNKAVQNSYGNDF